MHGCGRQLIWTESFLPMSMTINQFSWVAVRNFCKWTAVGCVLLLSFLVFETGHQSRQAVAEMRMQEIVAQHRQEWLEYHEARELKRLLDKKGWKGNPSETLKMTIYKPEALARARQMHEQELAIQKRAEIKR